MLAKGLTYKICESQQRIHRVARHVEASRGRAASHIEQNMGSCMKIYPRLQLAKFAYNDLLETNMINTLQGSMRLVISQHMAAPGANLLRCVTLLALIVPHNV